MAIVQLRHDTDGRRYYDRKRAAGKSPMEAMRALKRRLSDVVYASSSTTERQREQRAQAGPGGQAGAAIGSSAAGYNPDTGASEKSLPEPATPEATPTAATNPDPPPTRSRHPATAPTRPAQPGSSAPLDPRAITGAPSQPTRTPP